MNEPLQFGEFITRSLSTTDVMLRNSRPQVRTEQMGAAGGRSPTSACRSKTLSKAFQLAQQYIKAVCALVCVFAKHMFA